MVAVGRIEIYVNIAAAVACVYADDLLVTSWVGPIIVAAVVGGRCEHYLAGCCSAVDRLLDFGEAVAGYVATV